MPFKNPHPLYSTWIGLKQRCYNKNCKSYPSYGGRGITVCDAWRYDFHAFISDMGERPEGHSLDRIDNNGPYSPSNCRWATKKEQQRNRRIGVFVVIDGVEYRAIELAELAGVKTDTIVERANRGLSLKDVISQDKLHNLSGLALGAKASAIARKSRTHCKRGHLFDSENTYIDKNGTRFCRKCHAMRQMKRRRIKK